jgi:hypothetical protein
LPGGGRAARTRISRWPGRISGTEEKKERISGTEEKKEKKEEKKEAAGQRALT